MPPLNFRDVGLTINSFVGKPLLNEGVLFRGGHIGFLDDLSVIGSPRTIVILRKGINPVFEGAATLHLPAADSVDVYSVASGSNRKWIKSVIRALESGAADTPIYVHCAFGRDRTGVIVGAILFSLEVSTDVIRREYRVSSGDGSPRLFDEALTLFANEDYFKGLNICALKKRLLVT